MSEYNWLWSVREVVWVKGAARVAGLLAGQADVISNVPIEDALDPYVMLKHIYDGNGAVVNGPLGSNYASGLELKLYFTPDRHLKRREVCEVIGVNGAKLPFYYARQQRQRRGHLFRAVFSHRRF